MIIYRHTILVNLDFLFAIKTGFSKGEDEWVLWWCCICHKQHVIYNAIPYIDCLLSGTVCYFTVHFYPGFSRYLFFVPALYASITAVESLMMAIASVVPNFLVGIVIRGWHSGSKLNLFSFWTKKCFSYLRMSSNNAYRFLHLTIVYICCTREYLWWSVGSSDFPMTYQNLSGVT